MRYFRSHAHQLSSYVATAQSGRTRWHKKRRRFRALFASYHRRAGSSRAGCKPALRHRRRCRSGLWAYEKVPKPHWSQRGGAGQLASVTIPDPAATVRPRHLRPACTRLDSGNCAPSLPDHHVHSGQAHRPFPPACLQDHRRAVNVGARLPGLECFGIFFLPLVRRVTVPAGSHRPLSPRPARRLDHRCHRRGEVCPALRKRRPPTPSPIRPVRTMWRSLPAPHRRHAESAVCLASPTVTWRWTSLPRGPTDEPLATRLSVLVITPAIRTAPTPSTARAAHTVPSP
jgi:hypothetical protein